MSNLAILNGAFCEHTNRLAGRRAHAPELRVQLDYPEDQQLIRQIYCRLEPKFGNPFGTPEILDLWPPALAGISRHCTDQPVSRAVVVAAADLGQRENLGRPSRRF